MMAADELRRCVAWALRPATTDAADEITEDKLDDVLTAAEQLWRALAGLGLVDSFGGGQSARVLPAALAFIRYEANRGPLSAEGIAPPFPTAAWYDAFADFTGRDGLREGE